MADTNFNQALTRPLPLRWETLCSASVPVRSLSELDDADDDSASSVLSADESSEQTPVSRPVPTAPSASQTPQSGVASRYPEGIPVFEEPDFSSETSLQAEPEPFRQTSAGAAAAVSGAFRPALSSMQTAAAAASVQPDVSAAPEPKAALHAAAPFSEPPLRAGTARQPQPAAPAASAQDVFAFLEPLIERAITERLTPVVEASARAAADAAADRLRADLLARLSPIVRDAVEQEVARFLRR